MVDPLISRCAVVELRGDPRWPVGAVVIVHGANTGGQRLVSGLTGSASTGCGQPCVERRSRDLDNRAQPLHLKGVGVVGDELEAAHQFISPAKYLAADRRMSRSVDSRAS